MLKKAIFKELFTEAKSVLESKAATKPSPDASGEGEAAILGDDSSSPVSFTELLSFVHEVKGCITNNDDGLTLLHVYRSIMSKIKDDVLAASHTALSIYDTALICINAIDAVVLPEWISLLADFCDKIGEEPQAEESTEDKHYRDALRAIFWDAPSNSINVQHVLGVVSVRCKFTFQAMHEITWTTAIASKMSLTDLGQSLLASLSGQDALIKMGRQRATFWSCFWARLQTLSSTSEACSSLPARLPCALVSVSNNSLIPVSSFLFCVFCLGPLYCFVLGSGGAILFLLIWLSFSLSCSLCSSCYCCVV